jgi:GNAT superfamily N-acetyltransferase
MTDRIEIRPYSAGDESQVLGLLTLAFGKWPKVDLNCDIIEHWRWKTAENPLNRSITYVAESSSEIIGTETRIILKAKVGSDIVLCEQRVDLAIDKKFRGKGVLSKLLDKLYEKSCECGVKFSYAVAGSPGAAKKHNRRGTFTPSKKVTKLVYLKDVGEFIKNRNFETAVRYKIGIRILQILNRIFFHRYLARDIFGWKVSDLDQFDDRFERFWSKISKEYNYILVRDSGFLKWRYGDQRGGTYNVKIVESGSELLGYVVLRVNQHKVNYPIGYIMDLLAFQDNLSVAVSLLNEAMKFFMERKVNEVQYFLPKGHPYERCAKKVGFITTNKKPFIMFFCYEQYREVKEIFNKVSKVYLSFGDFDTV